MTETLIVPFAKEVEVCRILRDYYDSHMTTDAAIDRIADVLGFDPDAGKDIRAKAKLLPAEWSKEVTKP